jgi:hypothetical protein
MKKVNFIAQSKGGVGKSLFAWFVAQATKEDEETIFIDLDNSTRTSRRLSGFIDSSRVAELSILDNFNKLDRIKFMDMFEQISSNNATNFYVDLGAPESVEFKGMFDFEFPAEEVAAVLTELEIDLTVYVVISGSDAMTQCIEYYDALTTSVQGHFNVIPLINEGTFGGSKNLESGFQVFRDTGTEFMSFGNLGESDAAKNIIGVITEQKDIDSLTMSGKMLFRRELKKVNAIIQSTELEAAN